MENLWETCGGFEGIVSCNNRKLVESGWENNGSVIRRWLSPSQRNWCIKESALSSFGDGRLGEEIIDCTS